MSVLKLLLRRAYRRNAQTWDVLGKAAKFTLLLAVVAALGTLAVSMVMRARAGPPLVSTVPPAASTIGHPFAGETYLWRPVAIGGGGYITGLDIDQSGRTRVVRTDVHGAYIWNDKADRWEQLATAPSMPEASRIQNGVNAGAYEIAVAPGQPNRLYMAIKGRLYKSDDGGRHWGEPAWDKPFPFTFNANSEFRLYGAFLAVSPDDPNLLFFGTPNDGLWRSTDAAVTWERVASVPAAADLRPEAGVQAPGIAIWFAPARNGTRRVFAASPGNGLFVADDPRGAFRPLTVNGVRGPKTVLRGSFAPDGSFFATDEEARHAWALRDDGWTDLTATGALSEQRWRGVAADPRRAGRVFISDAGGHIWCSTDSGRSWSRPYRRVAVSPGDPPWLKVQDVGWFDSTQISFDPATPDRLWVASGIAPFYADVGEGCGWTLTWQSRARGIEEIVANDVVQSPGHAPLFAGWDFGIHVKPDLNAFSTSYGPKERLLIAAQQVDWSARTPSFLVTNASDTRTNCCSEDGDAVLAGYSTDGGASWTKFPTLPRPPGTRADDPWRMSFGSIAVSADSTDNIVWVPAYDRAPFYTLDRGKSWHEVRFPGAVGPNTGSFAPMISGRKNLAADRVAPGTFYMVHNGTGANRMLAGLWRTQDRGVSWQQVFAGEIAPNGNGFLKLRAVPGRRGHLFFTAGVDYGDDARLRRSTDGGAHWQVLDDVDRVDDVGFGKPARAGGYPTIFITGRVKGRFGLWRSVDEARSWQLLVDFPIGRLDQVAAVEGDKDVFGRVYVGYTGSGWIYGEPAPCTIAPLKPGDARQCSRVDAPAR